MMRAGDCNTALTVLASITDPVLAPQALQTMAECYKKQQKWPQAIECFERILACPNSQIPAEDVKICLMDCYLANNEPEKALALRKELLSQHQSDAWRLCYIVGRRRFWSHEYSRAVPELEQAVQLCLASKNDPEIIDANKRLLQCYILGKQWSRAERIAQRLAKDYPDQAYQWHCEMGKCYQGQGEYDKAIACLEMAAELSPSHFEDSKRMYKALLDCYDKTGRLDKAISLAQKLIKDYPDEPAWRWELGRHYADKGEYDKAAPAFQKVVESSKQQWEIRSSQIYLGECLFAVGKGNEALEGIERYYKDKPDLWDEHLFVRSAVLFHSANDNEGCVAGVRQLLAKVAGGKKSSLTPTARELMYGALKGMGKRAEAASVLEDMAAESKEPTLLCRAARGYCEAGQYAKAKLLYKAVLERTDMTDDTRAECKCGLAVCYWHSSLKNAAQRLAQEVCDEHPATKAAEEARGLLYVWRGGD